MQLQGKVTVVTGAGKGIGRATAVRFAEEGSDVVLAARTMSDLVGVAKEVEGHGRRALPVVTDVSDEGDVRGMVGRAIAELGGIDILINNAGTAGDMVDLMDMSIDQWDAVLNVNLRGTMLCSKYVMPHMASAGGGSIVNLSSTNGRRGLAGRSHYCTSKWAIHGLTHSLAWEGGKHGIRVNCVAPGATETEELRRSLEVRAEYHGKSYEAVVEEIAAEAPLKRLLVADEIVGAILYLAGGTSMYMTGQVVNVNAGAWMS